MGRGCVRNSPSAPPLHPSPHHHPQRHPSPRPAADGIRARDPCTFALCVTLKAPLHPSVRRDQCCRSLSCCSSSCSSSLLSQAEAGGPAGGGGQGEAGSGLQRVQGEAAAGGEEEEGGALPPDPPYTPHGRARGQEGPAGLLPSTGGWGLIHLGGMSTVGMATL